MRQVTFMDFTGINLFLAAHRSLTQAGGWLRLAGISATVLHTVQIVGIDEVLDTRDSREHALTG